MILPDHDIAELGAQGRIKPYDDSQVQPSSYDVRLAPTLLVPHLRDHTPVDLRYSVSDRTDKVEIHDGFLLPRGRFVLGSTVEWIDVPHDCVCRVEGKSSLARIGIQIHSAGYIDPGYRGRVTLEITNFSDDPVVLWPGILIGQLSWGLMTSKASRPYSGRYQDSDGVTASRWAPERKPTKMETIYRHGDPSAAPVPVGPLGHRFPVVLKFRYTNWRGREHEYVVEPETGPRAVSFGQPDLKWYLSGYLITRDGDPRPEMGPTRRRSFEIDKMRDIEQIARPVDE